MSNGYDVAKERRAFLEQPRGVFLQEDCRLPFSFQDPDLSIETWLADRFRWLDGTHVDTFCWDMGFDSTAFRTYGKGELLPLLPCPLLERWAAQGVDLLAESLRAARARGLRNFWNHRLSEIDVALPFGPGSEKAAWDDPARDNYLKLRHPDWVVPCWWPKGLWNLAHPGLRAHKVAVLRELASNYDLDGIQLDFARHTPCLPEGREWELRDTVNQFLRDLRRALAEVEKELRRPVLLAAKIAENVAGCHADGFEPEAWLAEGLVDILVPGGRTVNVDLAGFRALPGGDRVKLVPCHDGHHTIAGQHEPTVEILRGVFAYWYEQGADFASVFNWLYRGNGRDAATEETPFLRFLREANDRDRVRAGPMAFFADGRGEYPWAGRYTYRADDKPLPATAAHGGGVTVPLFLPSGAAPAKLSLWVENMADGDVEEARLNDTPLAPTGYDARRADPHGDFVWSDAPAWPAADFAVPAGAARPGLNRVHVTFRANRHPVLFTVRQVVLA